MSRKLQEFSLYNLLSHSRSEHHEGIRILWADPKVQYVILFSGESSNEKAILTVGPDLDYKSLEEIAEIEIDGMSAVAFVKSRHFSKFGTPRSKVLDRLSNAGRELSRNPFDGLFGVGEDKTHDTTNPLPSLSSDDFEDDSVEEFMGDDDFAGPAISSNSLNAIDAPSGSALEKATTDEAWAEIKQREEKLENLRQELLAREAFISESENRLLEISQQHHERAEELNHKMESLKKWEMQLSERDRRMAKLEANAGN